ncbi:ribosomal protein S12 methylthiotransferase [Treponema rectale]|uniref:Ribosomal protein uS12 methylthiotransferase RimO n=1 Tax=Treponema rectale TaxID=744512 RepID=A0A840SA84_9SPIR|nr:30S ribosomal protein S12 methylthiotransferase RimO [Treponema rectale]MBB5219609.1 ribosomal protein S12 methylthiotransferase [Treponema rectale]
MNKTFFLDQHGCAKNQVDGELIITRLEKMGLTRVEDAAEADLIIINSCGFIESAKKESLDSLMGARTAYPDAKIILAGCLAERYAELFKTELPEADGIFGNGNIDLIDSAVKELFDGKRPVVKPAQKGVCSGDRDTYLNFKGSAYVKITEGCNNRCTFCAIPIIRGELRSRNADEIVKEMQQLSDSGIHEINLIGQDLAAYGTGATDDGFTLPELIKKISKEVKGNIWIRLLYIHPDHFVPEILDEMKKDSRFLPYFDIPFQSGDSDVIHAMNRKGSSQEYIRLVKKIREVFPQSAVRTTFLTGFPGETEKAAENTCDFLKAIESDWSGCFTYSREDDTPAARMKNTVPKKVAVQREHRLQEIQSEITERRLKERTGKIYDVLVEEIVENQSGGDDGLAIGRAWFQAPEIDGSVVIRYDLDDSKAVSEIVPGALVKVKVFASSQVDVDGEYCGS